jgi:hypothetical protein
MSSTGFGIRQALKADEENDFADMLFRPALLSVAHQTSSCATMVNVPVGAGSPAVVDSNSPANLERGAIRRLPSTE